MRNFTAFEKAILLKMAQILRNAGRFQEYKEKNTAVHLSIMVDSSNALADLYNLIKDTENEDLKKSVHEMWARTDASITAITVSCN